MRPGKRKQQKHTPWGALAEQAEKLKANICAKVEHRFRVIKRRIGRALVRYRGLAKNAAQLLTLFALSNIWIGQKNAYAQGSGMGAVECAKRAANESENTQMQHLKGSAGGSMSTAGTYPSMPDSQTVFWTSSLG